MVVIAPTAMFTGFATGIASGVEDNSSLATAEPYPLH